MAAEVTARPGYFPGRRYDRVFFAGIVCLLEATVLLGFAHTYYFAGLFQAPLSSPILHVHAAVFSGWMTLLLIQTMLISAGSVSSPWRVPRSFDGRSLLSFTTRSGPF